MANQSNQPNPSPPRPSTSDGSSPPSGESPPPVAPPSPPPSKDTQPQPSASPPAPQPQPSPPPSKEQPMVSPQTPTSPPPPVPPSPHSPQPPLTLPQDKADSSLTKASEDQPSPPPPTAPLIPKSATNNVKKSTGKKLKGILLVFISLIILIGGGLTGIWLILNRPGKDVQVTITYWGLWEQESVMKPIFDQYMAENPNVTINYINSSPQEYRQRLLNQLASESSGPNIFRFHNTWVPMLKNHLAPIPQEIFSNQEFKNTFYPVAQSDLKRGATFVGIPLMIDGLGLYYNVDLFIEGGQEPPTDWVNFRRVARQLTARDNNGNIQTAGAALGITGNVDHWPDILAVMMLQAGANLANPNNKTGQEALTFHTLFNKTDRVWDNTLPNSTLAFATGKLAMYFGPAWKAHTISQLAKQNDVNLRFKIIPIPQLPETNVTWASYWVEGVANKSPKPVQVASWDLLAYLSQPDIMAQVYNFQSQTRDFGEIYSRMDMADQLKDHPLAGAYVLQAPAARSWFLASDTTDKGGINDRIIKYYRDAVNAMRTKSEAEAALKSVRAGVNKVLKEYGVN